MPEHEPIELLEPVSFPAAIKAVPVQYGFDRIGQPGSVEETRTVFNIIAILELEEGSAQVTLVAGYASRNQAEAHASWIRSRITNDGNIPEAIDRTPASPAGTDDSCGT